MSDENSSLDWIPAGWTVEVRVRKNGKKDKYYTDPSNKLKFYSKLEVLRYLDSIKINHPTAEEKKTSASKCSAINAVVEKAGAEGLPSGWRVEMRVRKNSGKTRTDALTAEAGGQKVADSGIDRRVARNQSLKLVVAVKDEQIDKSDCTDLIQLSVHASHPCSEGAAMSSSNRPETNCLEERERKIDSSRCDFVSAPAVVVLTEQKPSKNMVKGHMSKTTQHGISKLNEKKGPDVPRRASKRLAGISVDTTPILKTNNRDSRVAGRQSGEVEAGSTENGRDLASPGKHIRKVEIEENMADEEQECPIIKPIEKISANQVKTDGLEQREGKGDSSVCDFVSAPSVGTLTEQQPLENVVKVNENRKAWHGIRRLNDKEGFDLPHGASNRLVTIKAENLSELKTNNGARNSGEVEAGSAENIGNLVSRKEDIRTAQTKENMGDEKQDCLTITPLEELSIPKGHVGQVKTDNSDNNKLELPMGLSSSYSWMEVDPCIEFAIKTLTGAIPIRDLNKADKCGSIDPDLPVEKPGSPVLPFGDLWTDPCIEFAIKTLMGEISMENNVQMQDHFPNQLSSSKHQGDNGFTIPNVSLDNDSCQAHLPSQHFADNTFDLNNWHR